MGSSRQEHSQETKKRQIPFFSTICPSLRHIVRLVHLIFKQSFRIFNYYLTWLIYNMLWSDPFCQNYIPLSVNNAIFSAGTLQIVFNFHKLFRTLLSLLSLLLLWRWWYFIGVKIILFLSEKMPLICYDPLHVKSGKVSWMRFLIPFSADFHKTFRVLLSVFDIDHIQYILGS